MINLAENNSIRKKGQKLAVANYVRVLLDLKEKASLEDLKNLRIAIAVFQEDLTDEIIQLMEM